MTEKTPGELRGSGHPQHEGEIQIQGLNGSVSIVRDAHGVPHITAESEHDVWFAQGFCHGQDRLWQLERFRRFARGTLSEILGEALIPVDRFYRRLGIQRHSERDWLLLGADARKIVRWFTDGVNAAIASFDDLPPEFQVLGIQPDWWTPEDSIAVWRVITFTQMADFTNKILAGSIHAKYGEDAVSLLQPEYPGGAPVVVPTGADAENIGSQLAEILRQAQELVGLTTEGVGSNNWAVSGEKSASGKPLLAGDPHAVVQIAPVWYLNHLTHSEFDVIGASTPGVPGMLMYGHNHKVAWSVTNAIADVSDLFVERFNEDYSLYEHEGEWLAPEVWDEEIAVKGRDEPLREQILVTKHGPVVAGGPGEEGPALAHQWTGHEVLRTFETLPGSFRARDVDEYVDSQSTWVGPPMNKIVADTQGNIAYQLVGDIPLRKHGGANPVPVPGWSGDYDWQGSIPFEQLPSSLNPETHYVATANNRVVDETYPHWIGGGTPWRAWRIETMLKEDDAFDVAGFQRMQTDRFSMATPIFQAALEKMQVAEELQPYADMLKDWDGVLAPDSAAAALYQTTGVALMKRLYAFVSDLPGGSTAAALWRTWPSSKVLEQMTDDNTGLLDLNPETRGRSWSDVVNQALREATAKLHAEQGEDPQSWSWGALHRQRFVHNLGREAPHDETFNIADVPVGGDGSTVFAASVDLRDYRAPSGVSYRQIIDLDDFAKSVWILPPGQSGHPGSPHYQDGIEPWLKGEYWSMSTRPEDYGGDGSLSLTLVPSN
jgi:penicillin amidase